MSRDYSIFCMYADDVRREETGKTIMIGVYQGGMNIAGKLPIQLPQLFVVTHLIASPIAPPITALKIGLYYNDQPIIELDPPLSDFAPPHQDQEPSDNTVLQVTVGLQPFNIDKSGRLVPKVLINSNIELTGNALTIRQTEQSSQAVETKH